MCSHTFHCDSGMLILLLGKHILRRRDDGMPIACFWCVIRYSPPGKNIYLEDVYLKRDDFLYVEGRHTAHDHVIFFFSNCNILDEGV